MTINLLSAPPSIAPIPGKMKIERLFCLFVYILLKQQYLPTSSYIWRFGPQSLELCRRIRRCGLVGGGVSLGVGFEDSKAHTILIAISLPHDFGSCKILATAPLPCLPACCHAAHHDGHTLTIWNCKQVLERFIYKLPWPLGPFTGIVKWLRHLSFVIVFLLLSTKIYCTTGNLQAPSIPNITFPFELH